MNNSTNLYHLRTESTFRFGVIGMLTVGLGIALLFFILPAGIILIPFGVNIFLSRQKTELDVQKKELIRTNFSFLFPLREVISIAHCNAVVLVYENSVRNYFGPRLAQPNPDVTKYFEIQLKSSASESIDLLEFSEYAPARETALKVSQWLGIPLTDTYQQRLADAHQRREERKRKGFRR
ncbi:MAG: hypothetical protein MUC87_11540 [Bacteroidia bacterium]|jgi:hypothetical protein|nr:hypothetical protein [Bacteroidia bacterium]